MMTPILTTIVALGLAAAPAGTTASPQSGRAGTPANDRQVTVQVENNNFQDVDVYAMSQGMTWRLGTVAALQQTSFKLPQGMVVPDGDVRLIFAPIGAWNYWVSPRVLVSPGDRLTSQVGSSLDFSTVMPS
jgi:hypothetical protein